MPEVETGHNRNSKSKRKGVHNEFGRVGVHKLLLFVFVFCLDQNSIDKSKEVWDVRTLFIVLFWTYP